MDLKAFYEEQERDALKRLASRIDDISPDIDFAKLMADLKNGDNAYLKANHHYVSAYLIGVNNRARGGYNAKWDREEGFSKVEGVHANLVERFGEALINDAWDLKQDEVDFFGRLCARDEDGVRKCYWEQ